MVVRAESAEIALSDFVALADPVGLHQPDASRDAVVAVVRHHLESSTGWLLVFDNAQSAGDIRPLLPAKGGGHVIITTRDPRWVEQGTTISVEPLTREEAVGLLLDRTGHQDRAAAEELARTLGDLPLSLQQAGAYIEERGITISRYLDLLGQQRGSDNAAVEGFSDRQTIRATWNIAIDAVTEQSAAAVELVLFCACLDPSGIPISLLLEGASVLPDSLRTVADNRRELNDSFLLLRQYSLVQIKGDRVSINPMVWSMLREQGSPDERRGWAIAALRLLERCFPKRPGDLRNWPASSELLPHALAAIEQAQALGVEPVPTALLLIRIAAYWRERAQLQQSIRASQEAVAILQSAVGSNHIHVASALIELAAGERESGDVHRAKTTAERALGIAMSQVGSMHETTAEALNESGLILDQLGEPAQARTMFERALHTLQELPGSDNGDIAKILSNVGLAYWRLGALTSARDTFLRAREILEQTEGVEHPALLTVINNLGVVLYQQGDLVRGRAYLEWALEAKERRYGPDHLTVASTLSNLGGVIGKLGEYENARLLLDRALKIEVTWHGYYHANVVHIMNNLGAILVEMGQLQRGKSILQQALQIASSLYGAAHVELIGVLINLGLAFQALGDLQSAKSCFDRAKVIEKRANSIFRKVGLYLKKRTEGG